MTRGTGELGDPGLHAWMMVEPKAAGKAPETNHLAYLARFSVDGLLFFPGSPMDFWRQKVCSRLARNAQAAADTGHELPEETLKAARDFLGILVGR